LLMLAFGFLPASMAPSAVAANLNRSTRRADSLLWPSLPS
jgi:hypothetical protein